MAKKKNESILDNWTCVKSIKLDLIKIMFIKNFVTSLFAKFLQVSRCQIQVFSLFSFCNGFNRKSYVKMWLRRQNVKVIVPLPSNLKFFVITKRWKGKKIFESDQDLVGASQLHLSSYIYIYIVIKRLQKTPPYKHMSGK